jgi:hypothetical protein
VCAGPAATGCTLQLAIVTLDLSHWICPRGAVVAFQHHLQVYVVRPPAYPHLPPTYLCLQEWLLEAPTGW